MPRKSDPRPLPARVVCLIRHADRTNRTALIIAHVDHGKTTLVDGMLKQARVFRDNLPVAEQVMDSYDLERERGITILAKDLDLRPADWRPGEDQHRRDAAFGGEVERVMNIVDGVLLLVDAAEGPMPQTRLFIQLGASDAQAAADWSRYYGS